MTDTTTPTGTTTSTATSRFRVTGMTCDHCAMAVTRELSALSGVSEVRVDLASGDVSVSHEAPLDHQQVAAAVDEAGYQLAS